VTSSVPRHKGEVLPVYASRIETQHSYDRLSRYYDRTEGFLEAAARRRALVLAAAAPGEAVLEIGPGPGRSLQEFIASVGRSGLVCGVDLSPAMLTVSRARFTRDAPALLAGDATALPLRETCFDLVFMSFVLELLPTGDIPRALAQAHRVLKPGGRLVVLSLSRVRPNVMTWLWELGHRALPRLLDCRPIYAQRAVEAAGFQIDRVDRILIWGLPAEIVLGHLGPAVSLERH
jgi:ubiquinone/menaquinone biosynthesis C-methylase UbiE